MTNIESPQIFSSETSKKQEKESDIFHTVYNEMKKVAQETDFAKTYQNAAKYKKRRLSKFLEKTHLKPLRDRLIKQNPDVF